MKVVVAYDIGSNRAREAFAAHLQRLGLTRVQRSVFVGRADPQLVKEVVRAAGAYVGGGDVVHVIPVDESYWRRVRVVGTPYYARRSLGVGALVQA